MYIKIFHYLIIIIICSINLSYSQNKIVIEFQIGDEIITNIDILKEKNYLIALNNSLEKLPKNQIIEISKNSIIREKIKKSELLKIYDFEKAINEINRVSKKSYIVVESYRNEKELFNLQCWNTVGECFFDPSEWKYLFKKLRYNGDYEFIFFQ